MELVPAQKLGGSDGLAVVLENTGEQLFASPHSSKVHPTEMEQLMMISKIGSWLAEQPKQASQDPLLMARAPRA